MKAFDDLLHTIEILRSPQGCLWDREQTLSSMRGAIIEEAYEVVEAIDNNNEANLKEEIGDLIFVACFVAYLAQQEGHFTIEETIHNVNTKLIRRHPHVFSSQYEGITVDGVLQNWEAIKKTEKPANEHPLQSIPKSLPELQRLSKILSKMKRLQMSWKPPHIPELSPEVTFHIQHNPQSFIKGLLLYAFEQNIDLPAIIRELNHELISYFDKQQENLR